MLQDTADLHFMHWTQRCRMPTLLVKLLDERRVFRITSREGQGHLMKNYQKYTLTAIWFIANLVSAGAVAQESENFDPEAKYQATCFACHGTGQAHAPVVGDTIEWEIRLEKGFKTLVQSTINGLNGIMPARGLCSDCTDDNLEAIVQFMIDESQ